MQLAVLIPTYNRSKQLALTIESLLSAPIPPGMDVVVTVVDNNSTDGTRALVESRMRSDSRLRYVFEQQQGRSHALNRGITSTTGDLVGMVDDDEEVDPTWYQTIARAFSDPALDFIGGPYVPRWEIPPPAWMPEEFGSVVGWANAGDREVPFDADYPGVLMGGNAVVRRRTLERVGPYATWMGRVGNRLLSGEDREFFDRLLKSGANGRYLPDLVIHHHVLAERCTKRYFRDWAFWHGVSMGVLARSGNTYNGYLRGPRFLGIPRWRLRKAATDVVTAITGTLANRNDSPRVFAAELSAREYGGMLYGRHFYGRGKRRERGL
jgi:glycosyltransferase involved in cell wall biosynthesis